MEEPGIANNGGKPKDRHVDLLSAQHGSVAGQGFRGGFQAWLRRNRLRTPRTAVGADCDEALR
jgi:hypothetical protein